MEQWLQGETDMREQPEYVSYLLRLWRMPCDDQSAGRGHPQSYHGIGRQVWRASLESPHSGERLGFGCLEELFGFLRAEVGLAHLVDGDQGGQLP